MCGIAGFFELTDRSNAPRLLEAMAATLRHRGPDGMGVWLSADSSIGLANTRLAIIDIDGGKQPIQSGDGRCVLVFNGEIYNYQSLRADLENLGHRFRTQSDTEVLLEAYREWGKSMLQRLHGMFAFALYDRDTRKLFLARDRTGIKPLYYHQGKDGFYFGSELKTLLTAPNIPRQINYRSLADFFALGYPVIPDTFFSDVYELEPATWLEVDRTGIQKGTYWTWSREPAAWDQPTAALNAESAIAASLHDHMIADVPIAAFLSGGIDSSVLVAILARVLNKKVETFNVAFEEPEYDESTFARVVAGHLDLHHHEIRIDTSKGDLSLVGEVMQQFDQPFGDSSAIPTFLVCREMRKYGKVVIGGDGGDEMFGGYRRFWYADMAKRVGSLPAWLVAASKSASAGLRLFAPDAYRQSRRFFAAAQAKDGGRLVELSSYASQKELIDLFTPLVAKNLGNYSLLSKLDGENALDPAGGEFIDWTVRCALPNDYLRKVDMMSSAHGLEVRVPYLGAQVLEFAAQIPDKLRYAGKNNKLLLRDLAARHLPQPVVKKPKQGFGIPFDTWLGKKGRIEIQSSLESPQAHIRDLVRPEYVKSLLSQFVDQSGGRAELSRYNLYQRVWFLWSLELWLKRWKPNV